MCFLQMCTVSSCNMVEDVHLNDGSGRCIGFLQMCTVSSCNMVEDISHRVCVLVMVVV